MLDSASVTLLKTDFGFTEAELLVHNYLLEKDKAAAETICKETRVPKGRIYDVLNSLIENGFIEVTYARPKKYFVSDPVKSFSNALNIKERKLSNLEREAMTVAKKLVSQKKSKSIESMELITDAKEFYSKVSKEVLSSSTIRIVSRSKSTLILRGAFAENEAVNMPYRMMITNMLDKICSGNINAKYIISKEHLSSLLNSKEKGVKQEATKNLKELLCYTNFELRTLPAKNFEDFIKCTIFDDSCFIALETIDLFSDLYLKYPFIVDQFAKTYDKLFETAEPFSF